MQDYEIVALYWARSQDAVNQTNIKYGRLLISTSYSVLRNKEDCEECLNDTYLAAWNKMPADRPTYLGAYLTKIIRGISTDLYRRRHSEKRGGMSVEEELTECIPDTFTVEAELEAGALKDALNSFLAQLEPEKRVIFVRRYFNCESLSEIAGSMRISESKVKTVLSRLRGKLREILKRDELL